MALNFYKNNVGVWRFLESQMLEASIKMLVFRALNCVNVKMYFNKLHYTEVSDGVSLTDR